jgi:hypothetical protein
MTTARAAGTPSKSAKAAQHDKSAVRNEPVEPVRVTKPASKAAAPVKRSAGDAAVKHAEPGKQPRKAAPKRDKQRDKPAGSKDAAKSADKSAGKQADKAARRDEKRSGKPGDKQSDKVAKKLKVIRDSFTMPKDDYDRIAQLKQVCLTEGVQVKKSELLRAGLNALHALPVNKLLAIVASVETVKTGRPAKG